MIKKKENGKIRRKTQSINFNRNRTHKNAQRLIDFERELCISDSFIDCDSEMQGTKFTNGNNGCVNKVLEIN